MYLDMCVYTYTYSWQEASVQRLSDKNFLPWFREKRVPCSLIFSFPLHIITALQPFLGRAVHKSILTRNYGKSRIIVKQKNKTKTKHKICISKNLMKASTCLSL